MTTGDLAGTDFNQEFADSVVALGREMNVDLSASGNANDVQWYIQSLKLIGKAVRREETPPRKCAGVKEISPGQIFAGVTRAALVRWATCLMKRIARIAAGEDEATKWQEWTDFLNVLKLMFPSLAKQQSQLTAEQKKRADQEAQNEAKMSQDIFWEKLFKSFLAFREKWEVELPGLKKRPKGPTLT